MTEIIVNNEFVVVQGHSSEYVCAAISGITQSFTVILLGLKIKYNLPVKCERHSGYFRITRKTENAEYNEWVERMITILNVFALTHKTEVSMEVKDYVS